MENWYSDILGNGIFHGKYPDVLSTLINIFTACYILAFLLLIECIVGLDMKQKYKSTGQHPIQLQAIKKLGQGTFGTVFQAKYRNAGDMFCRSTGALKLSSSSNRNASIDKEISFYQFLGPHPNLVNFVHAGTLNIKGQDLRFLILEEIMGDMHAFRSTFRDRTVPLSILREISLQLLAVLEFFHTRGVVLFDLKLENAGFVSRQPLKIKVFDLGSCYHYKDEHGIVIPATDLGKKHGTKYYTFPEVFYGWTPSPKTDMFAFLVLLHLLQLNRWPYYGQYGSDIFNRNWEKIRGKMYADVFSSGCSGQFLYDLSEQLDKVEHLGLLDYDNLSSVIRGESAKTAGRQRMYHA